MPLAPPVVYPSSADVPVLLSVPHAGRDYPEWLIALCKGGASALHALEDPLVDDLVEGAIDKGIGAVVEGVWGPDSVFRSHNLMVKHSNEYRAPKMEGEAQHPDEYYRQLFKTPQSP